MELLFSDGSKIDILCVKKGAANNRYQRSELDWMIYNRQLDYMRLVIGRDLERYLQGTLGLLVGNEIPEALQLGSNR